MLARTTLGIALAMSLAGGAVALAAITQAGVRGTLADTGDGEIAGRFRMKIVERGDRSRERMVVKAHGLDATPGEDDALPVYDLWLVNEAGDVEADFGDMRLHESGRARFRFSSRRHDYPEGVESLREFGGGTMQIRDAEGTVLADGEIPGFLGVGDDNEDGSNAAARAFGRERLTSPDEESRARGFVEARYVNRPDVTHQGIRVAAAGLDPEAGPYTVSTRASESAASVLIGELRLGRHGRGGLLLSTRRDDVIPGGSVLDLGGHTVEVTDAEGAVVLTGTFPEL